MTELLELFVCFMAFIGLYALFSRLVVWLTPRKPLMLAVRAENMSAEELLEVSRYARRLAEEDGEIREEIAVLFDKPDLEKENALLSEGFLVYERK